MTPGKMIMFQEYKRVLTSNPVLRPAFSLKSTPDGYLLIRNSGKDTELTQRVSTKQAAVLIENSEPAE